MLRELTIFFDIYALLGRRLRVLFFLLWGMMCTVAVLDVAAITCLGIFVLALTSPEAFGQNVYVRTLESVLGTGIVPGDQVERIILAGGILVVANLLRTVGRAATEYGSFRYGAMVDSYFGERITAALLHLDFQEILFGKNSAKIYTYIGWRSFYGSEYLRYLLILLQHLSILTCILASLVMHFPWLTIGMTTGATIVGLLGYRFTRGYIDRSTKRYLDGSLRVAEQVVMAFAGLREIKLGMLEPQMLTLIDKEMDTMVGARTHQIFSLRVSTHMLDVVGSLAFVALVTFLAAKDIHSGTSAANTAIFSYAMLRILGLINASVDLLPTLRLSTAYVEELGRQVFIRGRTPPPRVAIAPPEPPRWETLSLRGVCYRYPGRDQDVLHDIALDMPRGVIVGIVGRSGAGKSTLLDIISGLLPVRAGCIAMDGQPLEGERLRQWRAGIAYVAQSPFLFSGTVAQNVAFQPRDDAIDISRVEQCLAMARADFILEGEGASMPLLEGGSNLSGGQRQRLALARALYRDKQVMILDEPTSGMDLHTEASIKGMLMSLRGAKTVFIVSHRLELLDETDAVLWLDAGAVKAFGPSEDVLRAFRASATVAAPAASAASAGE